MDDGRPLAAVLLQVFDPARGEAAARLDRQAELRDQSDVPGERLWDRLPERRGIGGRRGHALVVPKAPRQTSSDVHGFEAGLAQRGVDLLAELEGGAGRRSSSCSWLMPWLPMWRWRARSQQLPYVGVRVGLGRAVSELAPGLTGL